MTPTLPPSQLRDYPGRQFMSSGKIYIHVAVTEGFGDLPAAEKNAFLERLRAYAREQGWEGEIFIRWGEDEAAEYFPLTTMSAFEFDLQLRMITREPNLIFWV